MKHRALVIGAGRIGAGFKWHDDAYTHAGAYRALSDRVELVGFVEPDLERRVKANLKWKVPTYESVSFALEALKPDIVSVCTQPGQQQQEVIDSLSEDVAIWCEKPWTSTVDEDDTRLIQINYMRRGDILHQVLRHLDLRGTRLTVWGKDDIHTRCHFDDLRWYWGCSSYVYNVITGPCHYKLEIGDGRIITFENGGVDGGQCFKRMLGNLIDSMEGRDKLWSPQHS